MSAKNNILYMSDETKAMILETATLFGISQNIVKEVFEYLLMDFAIKICENPDSPAKLTIPYVGSLYVQYEGDEALESGELDTKVNVSVDLAQSFKKLIGDLHDQGYTALVPVMLKKLEQAILVATSDD